MKQVYNLPNQYCCEADIGSYLTISHQISDKVLHHDKLQCYVLAEVITMKKLKMMVINRLFHTQCLKTVFTILQIFFSHNQKK